MNKTIPPFQTRQQLKAPPAPAMSKREFMQQYVLARATTKPGAMEAATVAEAAAEAWNVIEAACK